MLYRSTCLTVVVMVLLGCSRQTQEPESHIPVSDDLRPQVAALDTSIMEELTFTITINASPIKVHTVITDSILYKEWASTFAPGSRYEGSWAPGSKMWFLSDDGKDGEMGMVSAIRENSPGKLIIIKHLGFVNNGVESSTGPNDESVNGAMEQYTLTGNGATTELRINADVFPEFKEFFDETWPQALGKIKEISERTS